MKLPSGDGINRKKVVESADKVGPGPLDQIKVMGDQDINARTNRAVESQGKSGVETPWEPSHQIVKGSEAYWQAHHANSQGLSGQTDWQHKGAKRGGDAGPIQRQNPWNGLNTNETNKLNQSY